MRPCSQWAELVIILERRSCRCSEYLTGNYCSYGFIPIQTGIGDIRDCIQSPKYIYILDILNISDIQEDQKRRYYRYLRYFSSRIRCHMVFMFCILTLCNLIVYLINIPYRVFPSKLYIELKNIL